MITLKTLDHITVNQKRILLRADLNIPFNAENKPQDITRIRNIIPTITELNQKNAALIIISHFGRPKGIYNPHYSLEKAARILIENLPENIRCQAQFINAPWNSEIMNQALRNIKVGTIIIGENIRFHPQETENNPQFAQSIAQYGDIFVNDAFSIIHRNHASTLGLAQIMPACAGRALQKEITQLEQINQKKQKPLTLIIGGSKISSKINILNTFISRAENIIIGGGMAHNFLIAKGYKIGQSIYEPKMTEHAENILKNAQKYQCKITLPIDAITTQSLKNTTNSKITHIDEIKEMDMIVDIGPKTVTMCKKIINQTRTAIWNGPLGVCEIPKFQQGTHNMAAYVTQKVKNKQCIAIAGGGDTIAAIGEYAKKFSFISTGGGAFLEWLENKNMPALEILKNKNTKNINET